MSTAHLIRISNELTALERLAKDPSYKDYVEKKKFNGADPMGR